MQTRFLLPVGLLVAMAASSAAAKEPGRPVVRVAQPLQRDVPDTHQFIGLSQPLQIVQLRPRVSSVITKVNFLAGQNVRKGEVLVELDPTTFEAAMAVAQAEMEVAETNLARVKVAFERAQRLLPTAAISQEDFEQAAADRDRAAATMKVAKAKLDVARIDLMFTKIVAPIDGAITSSPLQSPGNTVTADTTDLGTLVSTNPIAVNFDIDQETALDLRDTPNPEASLWLPRAQDPLRSPIQSASNAFNISTGTLPLRVLVPNDSGKLLPGMSMKGEFTTSRRRTEIVVAPEAVFKNMNGSFVYVVHRDDASPSSSIALHNGVQGTASDGMRIVAGLDSEAWVVVSDLTSLKPGMEVDVEKVTMPQAGKTPRKRGG